VNSVPFRGLSKDNAVRPAEPCQDPAVAADYAVCPRDAHV